MSSWESTREIEEICDILTNQGRRKEEISEERNNNKGRRTEEINQGKKMRFIILKRKPKE